MDFKLDKTNRKILQLLGQNARRSLAEIGKVVHLSAPAVAERVRKMEAAGVIAGFCVQIDPAAMGVPIVAYVLVRVWHGKEPMFTTYIKQQPEVLFCENVTGEKAFLLKIAVATIAKLDDFLERLTELGETNTMVVLSTIVEPRLAGFNAA